MSYVIIIPAHNEAAYITKTLDSIVCQTTLPKKVIVVNDHSTDDTLSIIEGYASQYHFIQIVNTTSSSEHLPGGKVITAFYKGYDTLEIDYDFVVKLDADIILPKNYFEKVFKRFSDCPKLGVFGGFAYEQNKAGDWEKQHPMDSWHVRGAFKTYSRKCFEAIGGLKKGMGWDSIDELLAIYHGYEVNTDETLKVKHLRPTSKAYGKKAQTMQGKAMYSMGYSFFIVLLALLKRSYAQRNISLVFYNLKGYLKALFSNTPKYVSKKEARFINRFRCQNILKKIKAR